MQGHGSPPPIPPRHLKPSLSVNQTFKSSSAEDVSSIRNPSFDHLRHHEAGNEVHDDNPEITTNVDPVTILGVGTGLNAVRFVAASTHVTATVTNNDVDEVESIGFQYYSIPDSIIGQGSLVQGTVTFQKLLRLDGRFEGKLISTGTVIIGPTGVLQGDLMSATLLTVEGGGRLLGNVTADKVILKGKSIVQGDVTCKGMQMDIEALLMGHVNIHPHAPNALSISLDPPLVVGNGSNISSSSSTDTTTAAAATKVVGTLAEEDTLNGRTSDHVAIPTSMSTEEEEDESASTVVANSSLPLSKETVVERIDINLKQSGSGVDRQDSLGAISWREHAIGGDDG